MRHALASGRRAPGPVVGSACSWKLEKLDDEDVETGGVAHRVQNGSADVAARRDARAGGEQHRRGELRGGGLAVGAGDGDPLGSAHLVAHAPGEPDIAPQLRSALLGGKKEGMLGGEARRDDHELGLTSEQRLARGSLIGLHDELDPDDGQNARPLLVSVAREDGDGATQFGERVGGGEARHPQTEHHDAHSAPVVVPAGERGDPGAHYWLTHSR